MMWKDGGRMKKSVIAGMLLGLTVLLAVPGCSKAADMSVCRGLANQFMNKLARGDLAGAYDMCDPNVISYDGLLAIRNNPDLDDLWDHYTSLVHGDGGQLSTEGAFRELRLAPATVRDKPGFVVHIRFRLYDEGWRVMAFQVDPPPAETD
jgi:hypothetical protein